MFHALNNRNSVLEKRTEPSPQQQLCTTPPKYKNQQTVREVFTSPMKELADQSVDIQSSIINFDKIEELKKDMEDVKIEHKKEV